MAGMNAFQRSLLSQNLVHAEGYAPALSVNSIRPVAERRRWALAANSSAVALPLHITATFTSPQQANLLHIMDASLSQQQDQMGLADSDTDDVVRLLVDTPLWLLGLTFLISAVHLCLDVLAFANDVSFWSAVSTSTLSRLSLRALAADLLCQSIVGAYLWQNGASVLLLIPTALGIAVGAWKLSKTLASSQGASFTTPATPSQRYDAEAAQYMLWLLAPLLLGWAAFALIMNEHQGWGDYALSTAVAAVYASGFALACPQLLINYRLKSVAHMPWSVLFYRWCSVCIDDVFAFIIKMPTLHRLSVFRDDVVFLLYLAQRWYYPVDSGRTATVTGEGELPPPAEAGPACDDPKPRKGACSAREAYATLLTSDSFLPGVQALAFSLRRFDSTRPLLVLHTPSVKRHTRILLSRLQGAQLVPVDDIPCPHAEQVHVDGWVNSGYTKLHIWSLTDWHRIVYLDADTLVMADISDLFTCPTPAAAPDVFPPDKFNAGVLAITPSTSEFERLRRAVPTAPSHDGGDTGFLNSMYPGWFSGAEGHRLPFGDNAQRILHWFTADQAPGYWEAVQPLRVLHFSSSPKPWEGEGARRKGELEMLWWRTWMASKVPPGLGQLLAGGGDGSAPQTNSSK